MGDEAVEPAAFLTPTQRRDIFHINPVPQAAAVGRRHQVRLMGGIRCRG